MKILSLLKLSVMIIIFSFIHVVQAEEKMYEPLMLENIKFSDVSFNMNASDLSAHGYACTKSSCEKKVADNHSVIVGTSDNHIYKILSILEYSYAGNCSDLTKKLAGVLEAKYANALRDNRKFENDGKYFYYTRSIFTSGGDIDLTITCQEKALNRHSITTVYDFKDATVYDYKKNLR